MKKIVLFVFISIALLFPQEKKESKDTLFVQYDQITVSATRYPERVIEIPYAVSIINMLELQKVKGYGLDEVLTGVPGVLAQSRSGNQDIRIVIRGFGARGAGDRSNSGTSRGIRVMIDGFPETEPDGRTSFDQIDLSAAEEIEIVRSNASALWGNAAGGILNISTVPLLDRSTIGLRGMFGSFGLKKYGLHFGVPLGNGKVFGSVYTTQYDGWRAHSSSKRTVINLGFTSALSTSTDLGIFLLAAGNLFHIPGPLTEPQYNADPVQANPTYLSRDERRYNRLGRMGVTFDHRIDENNGVSTMVYVNPKYLQRSERGTFRDFTRYHAGGNFIYRNNSQFAGEINNHLTIGLDEAYQDGAVLFYSLSPTNGRGAILMDNKREGANNFGAFIQDEIKFNESLSILAGGRYDRVTYYSENFFDPSLGLQDKVFSHFTPKAGMTYMFSPFHSVYLNMGGGVEVPAGNETDPAGTYGQDTVYHINPLLEPILSTTFELGTKQIFIGEYDAALTSFSYDVALYLIKIQNDIVPYRGGRFYFTAGKTTRSGIEVGTTLKLSGGFTVKGAFTWSMNKYDEYTVDSVHYSPSKAGITADYKDNKVAGIPDMFYNASVTWSPESLMGFYVTVGISGIGAYFVDDANSIEVPSYSMLNASLGLNKPLMLGAIGVSGFISINNITDAKYAASAFINPDIVGGLPVYLEPGLPRNITASVSLIF